MPDHAVGLVVGVFDLFHIGHLDALRSAAARCDRLVAAVASDDLAARHGHRRPFVPETEREQIVGAVRDVEHVLVVDDADLRGLLHDIGADVVLVLEDEAVGDAVDAGRTPVLPLADGRVTASVAVRAALGGPDERSSVA
jgi:cytidyltransferase-like protein